MVRANHEYRSVLCTAFMFMFHGWYGYSRYTGLLRTKYGSFGVRAMKHIRNSSIISHGSLYSTFHILEPNKLKLFPDLTVTIISLPPTLQHLDSRSYNTDYDRFNYQH
jgi:hypothetical protein